MNPAERQWVWGSIAIVGGVGLVLATSRLMRPDAPAPGSPEAAAGPMLRPGARVLLVGDSLAQGLAPPLQQLAKADRIDVVGRGRQSTTIQQWGQQQAWLQQALAEGPFDVVLISLGTNDMKVQSPASEEPAMRSLLSAIVAAGSQPVWIAPPTMPFPDRGVRALVASADVPTFPSDQLTIPRAGDGIHGTLAGYAGWAGAIWHWLTV